VSASVSVCVSASVSLYLSACLLLVCVCVCLLQKPFQIFLLLIIVACVPWMLLPKPLILRRRHQQRSHQVLITDTFLTSSFFVMFNQPVNHVVHLSAAAADAVDNGVRTKMMELFVGCAKVLHTDLLSAHIVPRVLQCLSTSWRVGSTDECSRCV